MELEDLYCLGEVELGMLLLDPGVLHDATLVQKILKFHPPIEIENKATRRPLDVAAMFGMENTVRLLIDAGADINTKRDDCQFTPLLEAAKSKHSKVVEILIEAGADVNVQNHWGKTALHYAAENRDADSMQLLLNVGADRSIRSIYGHIPYDLAGVYIRATYPNLHPDYNVE